MSNLAGKCHLQCCIGPSLEGSKRIGSRIQTAARNSLTRMDIPIDAAGFASQEDAKRKVGTKLYVGTSCAIRRGFKTETAGANQE